jgi:hypothetical protein
MNRSRTMHLLCALGIMLGTSGITAFPINKTLTSAVVGFTSGLLLINLIDAVENGSFMTPKNLLILGGGLVLGLATSAFIDTQIPQIREQNPEDDCPAWDEAPLGYQYIAGITSLATCFLYLVSSCNPTVNG